MYQNFTSYPVNIPNWNDNDFKRILLVRLARYAVHNSDCIFFFNDCRPPVVQTLVCFLRFLFFLYASECLPAYCVWPMHMPHSPGGQELLSDPLVLDMELEAAMWVLRAEPDLLQEQVLLTTEATIWPHKHLLFFITFTLSYPDSFVLWDPKGHILCR